MTIKQKIISGFTTVIFLFVVSSGFIFYEFGLLQREVNEMDKNWLPSIEKVGDVNDATLSYLRFLYAFAMEPDPAAMDVVEKKLDGELQHFHRATKEYEALISSPEERKIYEEFSAKWDEYQRIVPKIKAYARSNDYTNANKAFVEGRPVISAAVDSLKKLVDLNAKGAAESAVQSNQLANTSKMVLGLVVAISAVVAVATGLIIVRSVTKPLHILEVELTKLAENGGDLTQKIAIDSRDEIGRLAAAVNAFLANLRTTISVVLSNAEQVAAASEELTASAEQSAQASNQVAVSITEVAHGAEQQSTASRSAVDVIEQMSAGIEQTAGSTNQVAIAAEEAAQVAERGRSTIDTAVKQMQAISSSVSSVAGSVAKLSSRSQEIGVIVDTISGIASQTNLLALNAAIEAARAGEQGRGFAVVADEVRKLAEQSQEATKKIAELINKIRSDTDKAVKAMDSGAQDVKVGIEVVNTAGSSFTHITQQINEVSAQIGDISATVEQLASSSQQVVGSVQGINVVARDTAAQTQTVSAATEEQSAAMQEIASASQSLARLAQDLQTAVGKFTV